MIELMYEHPIWTLMFIFAIGFWIMAIFSEIASMIRR